MTNRTPPIQYGLPLGAQTRAERLTPPREKAEAERREFSPATPLGDTIEYVLIAREKGTRCPCCDQWAQVYRRQIHSRMARDLILCINAAPLGDLVHLPTLTRNRGDASKLTYWGLIMEDDRSREDGGRAGWWRVTPKGLAFARAELLLPKVARVYDGKVLNLEGPMVDIRQCLGKRFDLAKLMAGEYA